MWIDGASILIIHNIARREGHWTRSLHSCVTASAVQMSALELAAFAAVCPVAGITYALLSVAAELQQSTLRSPPALPLPAPLFPLSPPEQPVQQPISSDPSPPTTTPPWLSSPPSPPQLTKNDEISIAAALEHLAHLIQAMALTLGICYTPLGILVAIAMILLEAVSHLG
jgi:hypothetical protein